MAEVTSLATVLEEGEKPTALMRRATDVASVCREIVQKTAMELKGKRYVRVEGWASIAAAYGCVPSIREVTELDDGGVCAICDLKRSDGTIVASAEGYVGTDEPTWATRPKYARRGMAQTRAVSRVCRTAFAFVVVMIDSNLSTTPAEEIPLNDAAEAAQPVQAVKVLPATNGIRTKETTVKFGKSKGKFLCDIDDQDLAWQHAAAVKSDEANDPKWGKLNHAWRLTVEAEVSRRKAPAAKVAPASDADGDFPAEERDAARENLERGA
jgi:hypothetical protein